ncbi:protein of unknown function [Pseudomonas mediterranea]
MSAGSASDTNPCGSRACPRWRQHSQHTCKLTHRYREQARSHSSSVCLLTLCLTQIPCGSEPYSRWRQHSQHPGKQTHRFREQARSHSSSGCLLALRPTQIPVGAGLARDGVSTANIPTS